MKVTRMFDKATLEKKPIFIAEIGQNHNGSLDLALEYIETFANAGATAVKFQTRDNKYLFDTKMYNQIYNSENAFAPTYGAHREHLEIKSGWYPKLIEKCRQLNVLFMSTPFDENSLELLIEMDVDLLKVASFDLGNLPFLNKIARAQKPVVISVGGGKEEHIKASVLEIQKFNSDLAILHCVSEYPCPAENLGLSQINFLSKEFPEVAVGSSDHFSGTLSGPVAYMQGARVFEKHVTLNRAQKGTDHSFALEPKGFQDFVRDVVRTPKMLPPKNVDLLGNEQVFKKLGKSLIAAIDISKDTLFTTDNLSGRIFVDHHIPVRDSFLVLGKKANRNILAGEVIKLSDLQQ